MNQTPREQLEGLMRQFADDIHHMEGAYTSQAHSALIERALGATDAILAVFKGLPAVQQEAEDGEPTEETTIYTRNDLRHQILAELGEQDR